MLRALVVGSHLNFNLEYYIVEALKELGIDVKFIGYRDYFDNKIFNTTRMLMTRSSSFRNYFASLLFLNQFNDDLLRIMNTEHFDVMISVKGESIFPATLRSIPKDKTSLILWFPDDPRFFNTLVMHIAQFYDFVFTSSTEYSMLKEYRQLNAKSYSLPFACNPKIHRGTEVVEEYDISFVGSYTPFRGKIISKMRERGIHIAVFGPNWGRFLRGVHVYNGIIGPHMVQVFNKSKICLNIHDPESAKYSTNMRDFEVTGSGGVLLTDHAYDLNRFFEINTEILVYKDVDDLINLVHYYLDKDAELKQIGRSAESRSHREHTYKNRIESMLRIVGLL